MEDALENTRALDALFGAAYDELRRLASVVSRNDPAVTLNPTALVHEAWLKLASSPTLAFESPLHFRRIAARAMRQVLVEAARRRQSEKRGGPQALFVTLSDLSDSSPQEGQDLLNLEEALKELERVEPRQAALVESRFFGGLEISEIATLFEMSEATAHRDWRAAKAWLKVQLR